MSEPQRTSTTVPAELPSAVAVLPLRDTVVFPEAVVPILVGKDRSKRLVEDLLAREETLVGLTAMRDAAAGDEPGPEELYPVGTVARIVQLVRFPDGNFRIVVQGVARARFEPYVQNEPFLAATVEPLPDRAPTSTRVAALHRQLLGDFATIVDRTPYLSGQAAALAADIGDPGRLADFVAASLNLDTAARQELLETVDVEARLERLVRIAAEELEILDVGTRIQEQVAEEMEQTQREFLLRRQLDAIRKELGEGGDDQAEADELRARLEEVDLPEEARKEAMRELNRLEKLPAASPEYHVIRTYLDWMLRFPWRAVTEDRIDVAAAREVLDADHHGLSDPKDRILEYLAVRKLKADMRGPILCLVGPPGVGKTSLGRSVARALGREFVRMSLGGVRDEAELRGHRRTYIGAMPGRVVQALARAGTRNPVFMLDEVDKLGADYRGDPASALLEIFDPEQNGDFRDHYLDVPIDLSQVLFIANANVLHTIPAPLRDRMEVIEVPGYSIDDKVRIGADHLVARQLAEHGLDGAAVEIPDETVELLASTYTREAGVRALDRKLAALARKVALRVVEGNGDRLVVTPDVARELLGPEPFRAKVAEERDEVGVATGLAVTATGGDVLFVEASPVPGKGKVTATGQLGDVMKESVEAAVTYVRTRAEQLGLAPGWAETTDVHVHVPEGAVPKDGPSAGVTLATAIASALTGRPVRRSVGMTGEVTLRGKVLAIGGVKEKVLAGQRAGLTTILLPRDNAPQVAELPGELQEAIELVLVGSMDEVLDAALLAGAAAPPVQHAA